MRHSVRLWKMLPGGEPRQLTNDNSTAKLSPVFSPDGSRIAFGTVGRGFQWDVWTVPVLGGEPQLWLRNASGLIWSSPGRILFSEVKKNPHMAVVTAEEGRINQRDLYVPDREGAMAHRSYPSPDGKSVLVAEMDHNLFWMPCRLLPMNGRSAGQQVGPSGGACTYATWSPDGKWMYFTSNAGGTNHIWRQRFPDGQPEQVTSGSTEEEGIAMAPDGRSFVTAVAVQNVSAWVHDERGEREVSPEGNIVNVQFAPDGRKLYYKVVKSASSTWNFREVPGEVRIMDLETGRSEPLAPGLDPLDYDVATDGERIVMEIADWTACRACGSSRSTTNRRHANSLAWRDGPRDSDPEARSTSFIPTALPSSSTASALMGRACGRCLNNRSSVSTVCPGTAVGSGRSPSVLRTEGRRGRPFRLTAGPPCLWALSGAGLPPTTRSLFRAVRSPPAGVTSFHSSQPRPCLSLRQRDSVRSATSPHCPGRIGSRRNPLCRGRLPTSTRSTAAPPSAICTASRSDSRDLRRDPSMPVR